MDYNITHILHLFMRERGVIKLRIGVCDDESIIRKELMEFCEKFRSSNLIDFELVQFSSGNDLLKYKEPIDILFLDIQMKGINGLRTALKIRETNDSMIIIFVTGYRAFWQEGYKVRAFRYLLKPLKETDFMIALGDAINDLYKNSKMVLGKDGNFFFIHLKDILYIECGNRSTLVRTKTNCFESVMTMTEWEKLLDNGDFYRVHKSYIVNMYYIDKIDDKVTMDNGELVEVSVRQRAKFKKACKEFRKRNAR